MYKPQGTDWHGLDPEEQVRVDQACNDGAHGRLTQEKGPGGGTGEYICTECNILKSGAQWRAEGKLQ